MPPGTHGRPVSHTSNGDVSRLSTIVRSSLTSRGIPLDKAGKYAHFSMEIYRFILDNPDLPPILTSSFPDGARAMKRFIEEHKSSNAEAVSAMEGLLDSWNTYASARQTLSVRPYAAGASALGLKRLPAHGVSGGAGVLQVFLNRFQVFAKSQGIELNECALAVSALALDIAAAGVGSVASVSGVGIGLLVLAGAQTMKDSWQFTEACVLPHF